MPSGRETVVNTTLTGDELKVALREAFERLLTAEGMLSSGAAFGRVAFTLALRLHLDNPQFPVTTTRLNSAPLPTSQAADAPALSAIERPPLGSPSASTHNTTFHRKVDSPNAERLALGLPVPAVVQQQDGSRRIEHIQYPVPADDPRTDPGHVLTEEEARAAGYNIIEDGGQ